MTVWAHCQRQVAFLLLYTNQKEFHDYPAYWPSCIHFIDRILDLDKLQYVKYLPEPPTTERKRLKNV